MEIQLTQAQRQIMSQQMIQSVNILQMSAQELTEYVKEVSLENPLVDVEEHAREKEKEEKIKKLEWLASLDEQNKVYYKREYQENDNSDLMNVKARDEETLKDYLLSQLIGCGYSDGQYAVFEFIAECLDNNGYYKGTVEEISNFLRITEEDAKEALDIMKNLDPAGVCSANLQECLVKQLMREPVQNKVEIEVVEKYLELLGKNQLHVIAKKMKLPLQRIQAAKTKIQSLNPKPGSGFSNREVLRYMTPDVTVVKLEGYFEVFVNDTTIPVLRVNQDYLNLLKSDCPEDTKDYIMDKYKQVERIQGCILKRNDTLLRLTKCLVDNQKEFFMYGKGHLKPMRMREAAEILEMHESTISRTVKEKYLQCCWGIFPMGYFFSKGFCNTPENGQIATVELKEQLRAIIENEDKHKPLSDQKLMEALAEDGIFISRRTVTKYRESMGIADCRGRKEY